jgi:thiamine biosynthesis lipoprotein
MRPAAMRRAGNATDEYSGVLGQSGRDCLYSFQAMATPCEVRIETGDVALAESAGRAVEREARRIEAKFSRYRRESALSAINASGGAALVVDAETAALLDFADRCWRISDGLFDVTSGVLRRAWRFDGSDGVPDGARIRALRPLIGWHKVRWRPPEIVLRAGMEIDFGGIAKEYAVDRALVEAARVCKRPLLVNFGGDLCVSGPREGGESWNVAIESVDAHGSLAAMLELSSGALATSGDARRFVMKDGVRYGHILDPRTGWPVAEAPRSVTIAARSCVEAGLTATLAMLQGRGAESFLAQEKVRSWIIR